AVGVRGLSMDRGEADIRPRERLDELLVGPIIDVHEAEVVVLAVLPAASRVVVVLEPVAPDDRRLAREALGRGGGAAGSLGLGPDRHEMAVVAVPAAVLLRREEPLGDEHRLAAGELPEAVEVVPGDPAVRIMLAQQGDEPLLGTIRFALLGVVVEERAAPPAHLVVREVPDAIGVASVRRDEAARPRSKPPLRRRVEWIDPVEAGRQAE